MVDFYDYSLLAGWFSLIILSIILFMPSRGGQKFVAAYERPRYLCAIGFLVFGIGIFLQWSLKPRLIDPFIARALFTTYFYIGGICFSLSYISLLNPQFLCRRRVYWDLICLLSDIILLWSGVSFHVAALLSLGELVFFIHVFFITITFFRTYHRVKRQMEYITTEEVELFVRWLPVSCYLIIAFGFIGVIISIIFDKNLFVIGLLMDVGIFVFVYLAWSYWKFVNNLKSIAPVLEEISIEEANPYHENDTLPSFDSDNYRTACLLIEGWIAEKGYCQENVNVMEVARIVGTNRTYVSCFFHDKGETFRKYITRLRINEACELLKKTSLSIEEVATRVGLSRTHFIRVFRTYKDVTPSVWRANMDH